MAQSTEQIASQIEGTRRQLGSNFDELEQKFKTATDWRHHFENRPLMWMGALLVGGALAGLSGRRRRRDRPSARFTGEAKRRPGSAVGQRVATVLDDAGGALLGVAVARAHQFIGDVVPGFREELTRMKARGRSSPSTDPQL